jgi:hypothetical protein
MILVLDEIRPHCGRLRAVEALMRERYLPGALRRGMELIDLCITPALELPEGGNGLIALWRLADVATWWGMRLQASLDADVAACWKEIDALAAHRSRRFLASVVQGQT